ncbi:MAG: SpoIIE family protein phosphatase [Bacteroidetes bacterium]|nr:SpoIIE family protein phosphatase [Bacteroidota bacterium]
MNLEEKIAKHVESITDEKDRLVASLKYIQINNPNITNETELAEKYLGLAQELQFKEGEIWVKVLLSNNKQYNIYQNIESYEFKSLVAYIHSLADSSCKGWVLLAMMRIYFMQSSFLNTLELLSIIKKIAAKYDDKLLLAETVSYSALFKIDLQDYKEAARLFGEAASLYKEIGEKKSAAYVNYYIATTNHSSNNLIIAEKQYLECIEVFRQLKNEKQIIYILLKIAEIKIASADFNSAQKIIKDALAKATEIGETKISALAFILLGEIYILQNKFTSALEYLTKANKIDNEIGVGASKEKLYWLSYVANKNSNDTLRALFFLEKHNERLKAESIRFSDSSLRQLEVKYATETLEAKAEWERKRNEEIAASINYAKRIQYALLAHDKFLNNYIPLHFVLFNPKDIVSGDFYWATYKNNTFYLAVCDSTGHGVPGAFMSLLNISFLNEAINERNLTKPSEIFDHARKQLIKSISAEGQKDGFDGILIAFDFTTKSITYAAANNAPIIIRNKEILELPKDKMPVGEGIEDKPFSLFTIDYLKNDKLYLYTDGFADQFGGPKAKKYKYKPLNTLLQVVSNFPMQEQKHKLQKEFIDWKGNTEQTDDVLVVGIDLDVVF